MWGHSMLAAAALLATSAQGAAIDATPVQLTLAQVGGAGLSFTAQLFPKVDAASGAVVDFDARVAYEFHGDAFDVTLVDRRAYVRVGAGAVSCLPKSQLPPLADLVDAFRHPTAVVGKTCAGGAQPMGFVFSGETFAFCAKSGSVPASAGDVASTLALLRANSEATPSRDALASSLPVDCPVVYDAVELAAAGTVHSRELKAEATECACKDGLKACLFVHGMGLKDDGPALDEYPKCWGDIKKQAKCCSSMKFMQMDTTNNAWYGDYLSKKVCDTAVAMAAPGSSPMALEGLAIVGHSMGNLVVANAELKGFCALGASSKWISLAGPFLGSQSANFALGACSSGNSAVVGTLSFFGLCPIGDTIGSLPYIYSDKSNVTVNALYEKAGVIYRKKVTSNLCGVSATGLTSAKAIRYGLLGSISGHATAENDGSVHILSCQAGLDTSKYSTTWSGGNFYRADINHGDSSFTEGDGLFGDSRKPIKWFNCQF